MREIDKVRAYDAQFPGVEISSEQKAERVERKQSLARNGINNRSRRATVGSFVVTKVWPGHRDYEETA